MDKTNIEKDIKKLNKFCEYENSVVLTDNALYEIQKAIENILADRERLEKENERLSNYRYENDYCIENINLITKDKMASIQKNTYKIEIEDDVFVDIKELYIKANKYDSLIKEIEDKIKTLNKQEKEELKGAKGQDRYYIKQKYMYQRNVLQELLDIQE